jgi:hypothetical protein
MPKLVRPLVKPEKSELVAGDSGLKKKKEKHSDKAAVKALTKDATLETKDKLVIKKEKKEKGATKGKKVKNIEEVVADNKENLGSVEPVKVAEAQKEQDVVKTVESEQIGQYQYALTVLWIGIRKDPDLDPAIGFKLPFDNFDYYLTGIL